MPFSPRKKIPPRGHPEFNATVAFTYRGRLKRHLQRDHPLPNMKKLKKTDVEAFERELHAFREAKKQGEPDPNRMWAGLKPHEIESHSDKVLLQPLNRSEKERIHEEIKRHIRELGLGSRESGSMVKDSFSIMRGIEKLPAPSLQTLIDLAHAFNTPKEMPRELKNQLSTPISLLPELGKTLYKVMLFELLSQHLAFNRIKASTGEIRKGAQSIFQKYPNYDANLETIVPQIERRIIAQKRVIQANEQLHHPARKAFLKRIQQEIGDYYFPSPIRKKIYREAMQYRIEGRPDADIIHHAENQAFREAKQYLRGFLQQLGYRPEKIISLLGVQEMDPDSIHVMKRLWKLFKKYKGIPAAQKGFIDRAVRLAEYRERVHEMEMAAANGKNGKPKRVKEERAVKTPRSAERFQERKTEEAEVIAARPAKEFNSAEHAIEQMRKDNDRLANMVKRYLDMKLMDSESVSQLFASGSLSQRLFLSVLEKTDFVDRFDPSKIRALAKLLSYIGSTGRKITVTKKYLSKLKAGEIFAFLEKQGYLETHHVGNTVVYLRRAPNS